MPKYKGLYRVKVVLDEVIYLDETTSKEEVLAKLFIEMNQSVYPTKPDSIIKIKNKKDLPKGWHLSDMPYNATSSDDRISKFLFDKNGI
jgi:hypothetical protein